MSGTVRGKLRLLSSAAHVVPLIIYRLREPALTQEFIQEKINAYLFDAV